MALSGGPRRESRRETSPVRMMQAQTGQIQGAADKEEIAVLDAEAEATETESGTQETGDKEEKPGDA